MESERGWPDKAARDYYSKRAYILEKKIKSLGKADWLSKTTSQQACGFSGALADLAWRGGLPSAPMVWVATAAGVPTSSSTRSRPNGAACCRAGGASGA